MKASQAGLNPYAPDQIGGSPNTAMASAGDPVLDPRAIGLDGDVLDQLLKGRWQEGHETGYQDGHAAARLRYVHVFDDGFESGHTNGLLTARAQMAADLGSLVNRAQTAFTDIAAKTGSEDVRAIAQLGLESTQQMIETIANIVGGPTEDVSAGMEKPAP